MNGCLSLGFEKCIQYDYVLVIFVILYGMKVDMGVDVFYFGCFDSMAEIESDL